MHSDVHIIIILYNIRLVTRFNHIRRLTKGGFDLLLLLLYSKNHNLMDIVIALTLSDVLLDYIIHFIILF